MRARSVSLDDAPYAKVLSHSRIPMSYHDTVTPKFVIFSEHTLQAVATFETSIS
jgi:hypothetical protein